MTAERDKGQQASRAVRRAATVGAVIKVLRRCLRDGRSWPMCALTSTVAERLGEPLRSENRRATVRTAARRLVHRGEATRRGELLRCRAVVVHVFSTDNGSLLPDAPVHLPRAAAPATRPPAARAVGLRRVARVAAGVGNGQLADEAVK